MHQSLKEPFQTLTVMVPTDMALQRFPQNQLRRILNDETLSKGTCEIEWQYYIVNVSSEPSNARWYSILVGTRYTYNVR